MRRWPLQPYPAPGEDCGYDGWWALPDLLKFNHANQVSASTCWRWAATGSSRGLMAGVSTFRRRFLLLLGGVSADGAVHQPEARIVGEVGDATAWLQGEHLDGVMNYRLATACAGRR